MPFRKSIKERRRPAVDDDAADGNQRRLCEKYGTSMMGGCLPMLIQLPILFAFISGNL